jgi:hypothetical protein
MSDQTTGAEIQLKGLYRLLQWHLSYDRAVAAVEGTHIQDSTHLDYNDPAAMEADLWLFSLRLLEYRIENNLHVPRITARGYALLGSAQSTVIRDCDCWELEGAPSRSEGGLGNVSKDAVASEQNYPALFSALESQWETLKAGYMLQPWVKRRGVLLRLANPSAAEQAEVAVLNETMLRDYRTGPLRDHQLSSRLERAVVLLETAAESSRAVSNTP